MRHLLVLPELYLGLWLVEVYKLPKYHAKSFVPRRRPKGKSLSPTLPIKPGTQRAYTKEKDNPDH